MKIALKRLLVARVLIPGMRILSLGSFIIMRLTAYKFSAFKRDMPTKAFCKEVRHDVDGMRFVPLDQRERLASEAGNERAEFGTS